jgi:AraC family transcriptional regulator, ethanolamine operon transcriptional activator
MASGAKEGVAFVDRIELKHQQIGSPNSSCIRFLHLDIHFWQIFFGVKPVHVEPRESEELADIARERGWDLHFDQIGHGKFAGYGDFWPLLRKRCSCLAIKRAVYIHGITPTNLFTFLIPERREDAISFNGQKVTPDTICIGAPGDETALYLPENHMITGCGFEQMLLEETLHVIGSTTALKTLVPHTTLLALPPDVVVPLRHLLETAATSRTRYVEEPVLTGICLALAEGRGRPCRTPLASRNHWRYVRKVRAYLEDHHLAEAISLKTLCHLTGVGARTLNSAFQEVTGDSPMQFIKRRRLNAARHALFAGEAESVKSAALDHGFWHLGRFAHEYRNLFGEQPSETLLRAD